MSNSHHGRDDPNVYAVASVAHNELYRECFCRGTPRGTLEVSEKDTRRLLFETSRLLRDLRGGPSVYRTLFHMVHTLCDCD